jgi:hypothetical protein
MKRTIETLKTLRARKFIEALKRDFDKVEVKTLHFEMLKQNLLDEAKKRADKNKFNLITFEKFVGVLEKVQTYFNEDFIGKDKPIRKANVSDLFYHFRGIEIPYTGVKVDLLDPLNFELTKKILDYYEDSLVELNSFAYFEIDPKFLEVGLTKAIYTIEDSEIDELDFSPLINKLKMDLDFDKKFNELIDDCDKKFGPINLCRIKRELGFQLEHDLNELMKEDEETGNVHYDSFSELYSKYKSALEVLNKYQNPNRPFRWFDETDVRELFDWINKEPADFIEEPIISIKELDLNDVIQSLNLRRTDKFKLIKMLKDENPLMLEFGIDIYLLRK